MDGKWIAFIEQPSKGKTKRYAVVNKETTALIGHIQWYGGFRQYSFYPSANCIFEKTCLKDITSFLEKLMMDRKLEKQNAALV